MTTVPHDEVRVTVGVDTHEDVHVAVAVDQLGRWLAETWIATNTGGFARLVGWASEFGVIDRFGVEGTGSWGAGLARWLRAEGLVVIEVDRPKRKHRGTASPTPSTPKPRHGPCCQARRPRCPRPVTDR